MTFGFDPEVPAGFQDADIEMLEMAEAAEAYGERDPWKECSWCPSGNQVAVGTRQYLIGGSLKTVPYCEAHDSTSQAEKEHFDSIAR